VAPAGVEWPTATHISTLGHAIAFNSLEVFAGSACPTTAQRTDAATRDPVVVAVTVAIDRTQARTIHRDASADDRAQRRRLRFLNVSPLVLDTDPTTVVLRLCL